MKLKEKLEQELKAKNTDVNIDEHDIEKVEKIIKVLIAHERLYNRMKYGELAESGLLHRS